MRHNSCHANHTGRLDASGVGQGPAGRDRTRRTARLRRLGGFLLVVLCLFGAGYAGGLHALGGPAPAVGDGGASLPGRTGAGGSGSGQGLTGLGAGGSGGGQNLTGLGPGSAGDDLVDSEKAMKGPYELLLASQLPSGAIKVKPDDDRVIPYFANLAAMALVESRPGDVQEYLEWYLAHLNRPDRWGLAGTVYDYTVDRYGWERPTMGYDSADSYAATFLTLVRAYLDWTGDVQFVEAHLDELRLVASVILQLQDQDGLVWATPAGREKYLMDNCENFRGLHDWAAVLTVTGHAEEAAAATAAAERVLEGIETRLWNPKRGNYDWGIYTIWLGSRRLVEISRESGWKRWYPDTVAQVFPVVTGLLRPSDPRAVDLYENLNEWHPGWVNQVKKDPHPWSVLGYAAAVMGDAEQARAFTRATAAVYLGDDGPYSGLSWELAYHLLTLSLLGGKNVPGPTGPGPAPVS